MVAQLPGPILCALALQVFIAARDVEAYMIKVRLMRAIARDTLFETVNDSKVHVHDKTTETKSHHISEREAALIKCQLKRKARCYEKKVFSNFKIDYYF